MSDCLVELSQMIGYVAVPWWITTQGGVSELATYGVVLAVVTLLCRLLLSPFGDRWPKRLQIVLGLTAQVLVATAIAALALSDHYRFPLLLAAEMAAAVAHALVGPALAHLAAELVPPTQLAEVLSLQKAGAALGRILGPLLAGVLIAAGGVQGALVAMPLLYLAAAAAACFIPAPPTQGVSPPAAASWWSELRRGLIAKWAIPLERGWTLTNFLAWIFLGPAVTMLIPLKIQSLGLPGSWLGWAEAALSVGMLVGALAGQRHLVQRVGRYTSRCGAAAAEGLFLASVGLCGSAGMMVLALFFVGCANSVYTLVGQTHRTLTILQAFRVRMASVNLCFTQIAGMIGPALAASGVARYGIDAVYLCFGLTAAAAALLFGLLPRAREFLSLGHEEVKDWYRKEYPGAFLAMK
ncbi:MFS transporter [Aquabacterium sp. A7-Y]|uniref:MFS transporter n=1 Tax=Aquabacterium sp. A7-Y TaxID=1349605 RepID=UPI00223D6AC5|nr:MFS transporter [Aquabacterium sp. A7-Y]MCW7538018.1 MFS transporter [Aquabacterium sp. A7-Y]